MNMIGALERLEKRGSNVIILCAKSLVIVIMLYMYLIKYYYPMKALLLALGAMLGLLMLVHIIGQNILFRRSPCGDGPL